MWSEPSALGGFWQRSKKQVELCARPVKVNELQIENLLKSERRFCFLNAFLGDIANISNANPGKRF